MAEPDKSSLVILVPEAERLVADFRAKFDISAICGLPAHITVLFPFAHPADLSPALIGEARALFAAQCRFKFSLVGVCGFPGVIYLAPDPLAPFDALTRIATAQFPKYPPYAGLHVAPMPHLTVAQQPLAEDLSAVASDVVSASGSQCPLACSATSVALAIKRSGRWSVDFEFELA